MHGLAQIHRLAAMGGDACMMCPGALLPGLQIQVCRSVRETWS